MKRLPHCHCYVTTKQQTAVQTALSSSSNSPAIAITTAPLQNSAAFATITVTQHNTTACFTVRFLAHSTTQPPSCHHVTTRTKSTTKQQQQQQQRSHQTKLLQYWLIHHCYNCSHATAGRPKKLGALKQSLFRSRGNRSRSNSSSNSNSNSRRSNSTSNSRCSNSRRSNSDSTVVALHTKSTRWYDTKYSLRCNNSGGSGWQPGSSLFVVSPLFFRLVPCCLCVL